MATISKFYKRLRGLCEERDMTINELVRDLGLSSGSPTAWKCGTVPRSSTLFKIASYFGITTDYLTGASDLRFVPLFEDVGGAKISRKGRFLLLPNHVDIFDAMRQIGVAGSKRIYGALPHTPLKELFEKSSFRIFKNFHSF